MAFAVIETERISLQKMYVWKFDSVCYDDLKDGMCSPKMITVDPYNGTKYTGIFKFQNKYGEPTFSIDISPKPSTVKEFYYFNEDSPTSENEIKSFTGCKKLCIYVDVTFFRTQPYQLATPLCGNESLNTFEKLKQLWKDDSSVKFLIKCKGTTIVAIKPIMAARSPVFKVKESTDNVVEITDFNPVVVQKMVDFCENGTLTDVEDLEEVYKIADKYNIPELMKLALAKFYETMTIENVRSRLQMAAQYNMKDLKKWCIAFCLKNDILDF